LELKSNHRLSQTGNAILGRDLEGYESPPLENPLKGMNIPLNLESKSNTEYLMKAHIDHIYYIEDAEPPIEFNESCHPIPSSVDFKRILLNVMNALSFLHKDTEWTNNTNSNYENNDINSNKKKTRYEKWLGFLQMIENLAVSSDCFWYIIAKFFKGEVYKEV